MISALKSLLHFSIYMS